LELIDRIKKRIESGWCQNALAKTSDGRRTDYFDPLACSWCLICACYIEQAPGNFHKDLEKFIEEKTGYSFISSFNDSFRTTKEDVLKLLDDFKEKYSEASLNQN